MRLIVAVLTIVSMFPYLMIQVEATGYAVVTLSSGSLPFWSGVVGIAVVMAVYVSVGGWLGVIWTDALQGVLLTVGPDIWPPAFTVGGGVRNACRVRACRCYDSEWSREFLAVSDGFVWIPAESDPVYDNRRDQDSPGTGSGAGIEPVF